MSYKDKYADAIESQFYDLENRILADIVRRIKKTGEITSTADWQINRLAALGYSSDEIETMIKDALGVTYPEMFELYDKVIDWEYVRNKDLYEQINGKFVPYEENVQLQHWLETAKQQTAQTLKNLTATLGIVQAINGQYTFLPLTDYYRRTLDAAMFDITSGAFDYNSVLKRTVGTLAKSGIRTIDYASGYSSRLPVAVRRAVMTGVSQMTSKIAEMNAEKLGADHFEIAWHEHARPSHREWQGKVWSKEELVSVCGLGTVTGLCGVNCYHNYYPFIPGVSERNWSDEWLEEQNRKEDEPRTFKGKEYTAYEATQKQRQMETSMRARRLKIRGLEEGGADQEDIIIAKARYQGQIQEYKAFSSTMGLKPQMQRVYIDGLGKVANSGSFYRKAVKGNPNYGIIKLQRDKLKRGSVAVSQDRIDSILENELSGVSFSAKPIYNSRIASPGKTTIGFFSWGEYKGVEKMEIGKQLGEAQENLIDTLLHEELEVRFAKRAGMDAMKKMTDDEIHQHIDKTIARYFRLKGWDYGLVRR